MCFYFDSKSYNEKVTTGSEAIYNRLKNLYHDENDFEKASADLSEALTAYENVYTELGMKAGARLIFQLLDRDNFLQSGDKK